jgi:hypothetical protein
MVETAPTKNESETLFETYLREHGFKEWDFEPKTEEKTRRPDYRIAFQGAPHYFEVKEFRQEDRRSLHEGSAGAFDPYAPIREKIDAAREKFREYKEYPCSIVLYNVDAPLVFLDDWTVVMGAMLGDLGYRFAVDPKLGAAVGDFTHTFTQRGKMINYKRMEPQNTTISAVVALDKFPLGQRRLNAHWRSEEKESGRKMDWSEFVKYAESLRSKSVDASEVVLRVVVFENPYSRISLPRELFTGPFDERFGPEGDNIVRCYAGGGILRVEEEEAILLG